MAKTFRPVLTGTAAALLLMGCASAPVVSPSDPATMAAPSTVDCKAFTAKVAALTAREATDPPSEPMVLANVPSSDTSEGEDDLAAAPPTLTHLPLFSATTDGRKLPTGWQPWTVNRNKTPTRYTLTEVDQRLVLHAEANSSASGLYVPLAEREAGTLRWMWKTKDIIRQADNAEGPREDSPLRLFVAFDGDKSSLSLKDQLMYEMARLTTGREMPYATLMYIWGGKRAEGTVLPNPHTDRVRMIVVDSGTRHANEWRCHERDLRADYRKAFGTDPGRVVAVGLMTDTDNTKSKAEAWYGDIALD